MICRPKDQDRLGVEVPEIKKSCLLSNWFYKILSKEGLWQQLLKNKYLSQKTLAEVKTKPNDSHFWKGLMKVKDNFFSRGSFKISSREGVRFWEDIWLDEQTLASQYPHLYYIVHRKYDTVATVMSSTPINIGFRRQLTGNKWNQWIHICQRLMEINLNEEQDKFVWGLTSSGNFTIKSMYIDMLEVILDTYVSICGNLKSH
jgi:hypothetical protein